ncbi:MAG TPA: SH3 domain-containing protein, partial [Kofleriaceae bacterium]|nr:SH3 domain-containing protein [Kofleriaceae bacterium]
MRTTGPNPEALAGLIQSLPQQAAQILATIATHFGNSTVQQTQALSRHATGKVTASVLNVRSAPARGDNVVGTLHRDEPVEPIGQTGPWLEIPHAQQTGFVWSGWVELAGKAPPSQDPVAHVETQPPQKPEATPIPAPAAATTAPPAVANAPAARAETPKKPEATPVSTTTPPVVASATNHADTPPPVAAPVTAPSAVVTTTPPTTAPATATPHAIVHPGAATFETIEHTRVEVNQGDEGDVLGYIRGYKQQFDPHWLLLVQKQLQVGDATGAFNTETLRAIRDTMGHKLTGAQITDHAFLVGLGTKLKVEGEPYRTEVD